MAIWNLKGQVLSYHSFQIDYKEEAQGGGQQQHAAREEEALDEEQVLQYKLRCTFLCMVFYHQIIFTGSDDGYVSVWDGERIVNRFVGHANAPILSIYVQAEQNLLATGGIDGRVNLWRIVPLPQSAFQLELVESYAIANMDAQQAVTLSEYYVQSINIGSRFILAGTKSGDVYELLLPKFEQGEKKPVLNKKDQIVLRLSAQDNEIPCSVCFSKDNERLYSITQKGLFSVWYLKSIQREYSKKFEKETHSLIICRNSPKIIIGFEQEIIVLDTDVIARVRPREATAQRGATESLPECAQQSLSQSARKSLFHARS